MEPYFTFFKAWFSLCSLSYYNQNVRPKSESNGWAGYIEKRRYYFPHKKSILTSNPAPSLGSFNSRANPFIESEF